MVLLIQMLLLLVTGIAAVALAVRFGKEGEVSVKPMGVLVAALVMLVAIAVVTSMGQVNAGFRGVVLKFGAVTDTTLEEGLYMVTPLVETVEIMDVQTHAYEAEATAASKDLQDVRTHVTLNFLLDPRKVNQTYRNLRRDYLVRIVQPAVQESVKAVTATFNAEKLITERPEVKIAIEQALRDRLAEHGILTETISITDFAFGKNFAEAIEAKVVAAQKAQEAENKLIQVKVEAQQAEALANGLALAAIKKAEGDAKAIRMVADAHSYANEVLQRTLTKEIIQYTLVKELGPDIKVIILPSGQQFILGPEVLGTK